MPPIVIVQSSTSRPSLRIRACRRVLSPGATFRRTRAPGRRSSSGRRRSIEAVSGRSSGGESAAGGSGTGAGRGFGAGAASAGASERSASSDGASGSSQPRYSPHSQKSWPSRSTRPHFGQIVRWGSGMLTTTPAARQSTPSARSAKMRGPPAPFVARGCSRSRAGPPPPHRRTRAGARRRVARIRRVPRHERRAGLRGQGERLRGDPVVAPARWQRAPALGAGQAGRPGVLAARAPDRVLEPQRDLGDVRGRHERAPGDRRARSRAATPRGRPPPTRSRSRRATRATATSTRSGPTATACASSRPAAAMTRSPPGARPVRSPSCATATSTSRRPSAGRAR